MCALRITQLEKLAAAIRKLAPPGKEAAAPGPGKESAEALRARYDALYLSVSLATECDAAAAADQGLTLRSAHLANQESLCARDDAAALATLVGLADDVAGRVDRAALAAAFGVSTDPDSRAQAAQRRRDDARKKALVAALHSKALALCDLRAAAPGEHGLAGLDEAMAELHKWAAPGDHPRLCCRWHLAHGRAATAVVLLDEALGKDKKAPARELLELRAELLGALGWRHWEEAGRAQLHVKFPPAYPLVYGKLL